MFLALLGGLLVVVGVVLLGIGAAALAGRLPRNRWAGLRTAETLADDETFTLANRVAGPSVLTAGLLLVLAGLACGLLDGGLLAVALVVLLPGALGVSVAGGRLGVRAASARPVPHSRCADCTGCELMDSLRA